MENTIMVQRGNVILDIPKYRKEEYMNLGYSVIDPKSGEILEEAIPVNVDTLKNKVNELNDALKEKDLTIDKLKEDIKKLKKACKDLSDKNKEIAKQDDSKNSETTKNS